jgi:hypothetical protein
MIRNLLGAVLVIIGAFIFQIGFVIMKEDMQESFARKFVEKFESAF